MLAARTFTRYSLRRLYGSLASKPSSFDSPVVSEAEAALKKAKWRSMERGTKENELIFRTFFKKHEKDLQSDSALRDEYSKILDEIDPDLFKWLTKKEPVPADIASMKVWTLLEDHMKNNSVLKMAQSVRDM